MGRQDLCHPITHGPADTLYDAVVTSMLLRVLTAIQLTRLTMALGAVSNIWFVILITRADQQYHSLPVHTMPLGMSLAAGAGVAIGLFAYGAALNDLLDVRHDTTFEPERPIPAGRIRPGQAVVATVAALILAVLASLVFATTWAPIITLALASMILFYNTVGKHVPGAGIVTVGLIYAGHMFIANHQLGFTLPVWLILTHTMAIALAVHQLEDKRPVLSRRSLLGISAGWLFWSGVIIGIGLDDLALWPEHRSLVNLGWPLMAVAAFAVVIHWKTRHSGPRSASEKLKRYGAMWQGLFDASWLLALGLHGPAAGLGMLALVSFVAMTVLKELAGLSGRPLAYRA